MKVDRGRLFVAGGSTGDAFVYNAKTGKTIAAYELPTSGATFVNDVVVHEARGMVHGLAEGGSVSAAARPERTPGASDSVQAVNLTGDFQQQPGFNGTASTRPERKTLVIVQSNTGRLFTVTPRGVTRKSRSREAERAER